MVLCKDQHLFMACQLRFFIFKNSAMDGLEKVMVKVLDWKQIHLLAEGGGPCSDGNRDRLSFLTKIHWTPYKA